jgi:hypothetical protein
MTYQRFHRLFASQRYAACTQSPFNRRLHKQRFVFTVTKKGEAAIRKKYRPR